MRPIDILAIQILLFLIPTNAQSADHTRWPHNPNELEVSLSVIQALEEGPVVCRVNLKNVSEVTLSYATSRFSIGAFCHPDANWKIRQESPVRIQLICGIIGPYSHELRPGEAASKTFYLHKAFLSVPAGEARIHFGWKVYRIKERPADKDTFDGSLELLFELKRTQVIDVLPATEKNLEPVLHYLEAEFVRVAKLLRPEIDYAWSSDDPSSAFVNTIGGCRHKEFAPLLVEAIDRLPASNSRRRLIATLYESFATPEEGFAVLAGYLSSPHPASAGDVFDYWVEQDREHQWSFRRQQELNQPLVEDPDPDKAFRNTYVRELTKKGEEAWRNSKRHLDTRLSKDQFRQLQAIKNVWVRALLYANYPDQSPDDWVATLLRDLKQQVCPPKRMWRLITLLNDDRFRVREQATAELCRAGPTLACHLWAVAADELPVEAARRLRRIQERLGEPKLPRLWQRTILHLALNPNARKRKMLDLLASGDSSNIISRAVAEAYEQYNDRW